MRLHIVVALATLCLVNGLPVSDSGRSIADWFWTSQAEVQADGLLESVVGPMSGDDLLLEEGRRRSDRSDDSKKSGNKRIEVNINVSKNKGKDKDKPGSGGGHNTPIPPTPGKPPGSGVGGAGAGAAAGGGGGGGSAIKPDDGGWGWGWIKKLTDGSSWPGLFGVSGGGFGPGGSAPGGSGPGSSSPGWVKPDDAVGNDGIISVTYGKPSMDSWLSGGGIGPGGNAPGGGNKPSGGGPGSSVGPGNGNKPGFGAPGNSGPGSGKPGSGGPGNDGIVSITYGKPPADHYETHGPSVFDPFAGWLSPSSSAVSGPNQGGPGGPGDKYSAGSPIPGSSLDSPTMSEVMVIRYPEFVKTIGKGISKMTNMMRDLGKGMTDTLTKGISGPSSLIGNGVASIIPLEEVGNVWHDPGMKPGSSNYPNNNGQGYYPYYPAGGSAVGSPSQGAVSSVYVDKHPTGNTGTAGSWLNPGSWFGSGDNKGGFGGGFGGGSGGSGSGGDKGGSAAGSPGTSSVYVDKN